MFDYKDKEKDAVCILEIWKFSNLRFGLVQIEDINYPSYIFESELCFGFTTTIVLAKKKKEEGKNTAFPVSPHRS